ncbi:phage baseplate assembly protein V [Jiangella endophytica]|uniref:phage baseplate assembly protein V n=1 Tax=Jiangella endophytica TaxID=1623398 RepID=UPI000E34718A|nr:phage baseplate assembly protein V [Jiangella endophytica]
MTTAPEVRVGGSLLTGKWLEALVELRADRGLRTVGSIVLRFTDPGYALASSSAFGVGTTIEVGVMGKGQLAEGAVTGIAVEQRDGLPPELVVTAHDGARKLAGSPVVRTFTEQSFHDVVGKVAGAVGLGVRLPGSETGIQTHVLQVGTDLEFLDEVADRLSWDWWVDDGTVVATLPGTGPKLTRALGKDLQEFSASAVDVPTEVQVRGWNPWKKEAVASDPALVDATTVMSKAPLLDVFSGAIGNTKERKRRVDVVRTVANKNEADEVAGSLRDSIARAAVTARGRGLVDPAMTPGTALTVTNAGPVSGTYHVSRIEHVYRRTGFHTRFVAGDRAPASLVDLLGGREDVGRGRADAGGRFYGLMSGIVTDVRDPEKRGRAKVRFPAFTPLDNSDWARVATVGAGPGRGLTVLPEVDDEVLVAFEGGDLRHPVILAGLHNSKDKIPQHEITAGTGVQHRRFTSRLGHVIELADGTGEKNEHVLIALAGGKHRIRLGKDRMDVELPANVPMSIKVGRATITVDGQNRIAVEAAEISVKAEDKLTLSGNSVDIKATATLGLSASTLTAKGTGAASLESDGVATVKGKAVAIN